jgi:hypothetical protein
MLPACFHLAAVQLLALAAAIQFSPIHPHSYPLAVRNPYLNLWVPGNRVDALPSASAQFWTGVDVTWSIIARVDGVAYGLFGVPQHIEQLRRATVVRATYTSTHTTFSLTAASVSFELDFFSPVSPTDYVRQSLPFGEQFSPPSNISGSS